MWEAQTLGNSLSVDLRVGYSSVRTAGGPWVTEGAPYKWTCLLTYLLFKIFEECVDKSLQNMILVI